MSTTDKPKPKVNLKRPAGIIHFVEGAMDKVEPISVPLWDKTTLGCLLAQLDSAKFRKQFNKLTENEDRFKLVMSQSAIRDTLESFVAIWQDEVFDRMCAKDSVKANKIRNAGNRAFLNGEYMDALDSYSRAIRYAPQAGFTENIDDDGASELPFAYGNRSAVFFKAAEYEAALLDIEAAISLNYARFQSPTKLLLRKAECLLRLGRSEEAKECLESLGQPEDPKDAARLKVLADLVTKNHFEALKPKENDFLKDPDATKEELLRRNLFSPNQKLSSLSSKVELRYSPTKGRHLVATEDVQFGEILSVMRPYVSYLRDNKENKFCHQCCRPFHFNNKGLHSDVIRSVPCHKCAIVAYCSEKCRDTSWDLYHRYECGFIPLLRETLSARLALRILLRTGLEKTRQVFEQESKNLNKDPLDLHDPEDYIHIYHLVHHSDKFTYNDLLEKTLTACLLTIIAQKCGFLKDPSEEDEAFVGGLMLRHILQVYLNAGGPHDDPKKGTPDEDVGTALYLPVGLMNHSCKPNCQVILDITDGLAQNFLQAAEPIPAGSELLFSYGPNYFNSLPKHSLAGRQNFTLTEYFFTCDCARCQMEMRDTPDGFKTYYPLACGDCGSLMTAPAGLGRFKCSEPTCEYKLTMREARAKYKTVQELFDEASNLMTKFIIKFHAYRPDKSQINSIYLLLEELLDRKLPAAQLHIQTSVHAALLYEQLAKFYAQWTDNAVKALPKALTLAEKALQIKETVCGKESINVLLLLFNMEKTIVHGVMANAMKFGGRTGELVQRAMKVVDQFLYLREKFYPLEGNYYKNCCGHHHA